MGGPLSRRGIPNALYSKPVILSTRRIEKADFGPGAHTAQFSPEPRVKGNQIGTLRTKTLFPTTMYVEEIYPRMNDPLLLHYRFHDPDIVNRWRDRDARRSTVNRRLGMGHTIRSVLTRS